MIPSDLKFTISTARSMLLAVFVASVALGLSRLLPTGGYSAAAQQIDLERIFTCEDQSTLPLDECNVGRELVTTNCVACHPFVQIVLRQYDEGGWRSLLNRHRERVKHLTDEEVDSIRRYLAAKFNPEREPPQLPPEIIDALTDY